MSISHSHFCFLLFLLSCNCLYPYPISKVTINTKLLHIAELVIKYFQFRMGGHTTNSLKQHGLQVLDPFHHITLTVLLCPILPIGEGSDSLRGFKEQYLFWARSSWIQLESLAVATSLNTLSSTIKHIFILQDIFSLEENIFEGWQTLFPFSLATSFINLKPIHEWRGSKESRFKKVLFYGTELTRFIPR